MSTVHSTANTATLHAGRVIVNFPGAPSAELTLLVLGVTALGLLQVLAAVAAPDSVVSRPVSVLGMLTVTGCGVGP